MAVIITFGFQDDKRRIDMPSVSLVHNHNLNFKTFSRYSFYNSFK